MLLLAVHWRKPRLWRWVPRLPREGERFLNSLLNLRTDLAQFFLLGRVCIQNRRLELFDRVSLGPPCGWLLREDLCRATAKLASGWCLSCFTHVVKYCACFFPGDLV